MTREEVYDHLFNSANISRANVELPRAFDEQVDHLKNKSIQARNAYVDYPGDTAVLLYMPNLLAKFAVFFDIHGVPIRGADLLVPLVRMAGQAAIRRALDSERAYQDANATVWAHGGHPSIADELVYIDRYFDKVMTIERAQLHNSHRNVVIDILRKVAGMILRCIENHGIPPSLEDN